MNDKPDVLDSATNLAIGELHRRLNENPELFPDHVLGKLVADLEKRAERKAKEHEAEEKEFTEYSLLEEVKTLPRARAMVLLRNEVARLHDELEAHSIAYNELVRDAQPVT